jgi:pregnancy-associated plasma protein-A/type IX secretion system substrate protein
LQENPEMVNNLRFMEQHIEKIKKAASFKRDTIPIVFHILISPGYDYPKEDEILNQIDVLNRDFAGKSEDMSNINPKVLGHFNIKENDVEIYFCLPHEDARKGLSQPINFIPTSVREWTEAERIKSSRSGGADPWDTDKYINVWVGNLGDDFCGYAQMPGGPTTTDGIVIDFKYFRTSAGTDSAPYNQGRTLTHLIGSYLGLYELWDETNPCGDDKVNDTPIHNGPNFGVSTNHVHISTCPGHPIEMHINFMDNTDDEELIMFTPGQKIRMKANLAKGGLRSGLKSSLSMCGLPGIDDMSSTTEDFGTTAAPGNSMTVFPNPAKDEVTVNVRSIGSETVRLRVFNAQGAILMNTGYTLEGGAQQFSLDCSTWAAGLYFLKAIFQEGKSISQSLMIER